MTTDGTTALARLAPRPRPDAIVVGEERPNEALGPRVYRNAAPRDTTHTAAWRWFALYPTYTVPLILAWCAFAWWFSFKKTPESVLEYLFLGASFVFAYFGIAITVNRTVLRVNDDELTIRHGPLPWPGPRRLQAGALTQLFCKMAKDDKGGKTYELWVLQADGSRRKLLDLPTSESALFLEWFVEERLAIADASVEGDYRG